MTLQEIKQEKENRVSAAITNNLVFFAFSNEQFAKNKTPLEEGEKYVSIGAGGYCPKSKAKSFSDDLDAIDKWYKDAIKESKLRKENIAYELNNHEAYYTGEIDETLEALGEGYTREEVLEVYNQNYEHAKNNY